MTSFIISTITAFITTDNKNNDEGVIAVLDIKGVWMPMICADEKRIESMIPLAEEWANTHEASYRIVQFSVRTDVTDEIKNRFLH